MKTCQGTGNQQKSHTKKYTPRGSDKKRTRVHGFEGDFAKDRKTEEKLYIIPTRNQRVNYKGRRLCAKVPQNFSSGSLQNKVMRNNPWVVITHTHTPVDILAQHEIRQQKPNIDRGDCGKTGKCKVESGKPKAQSCKEDRIFTQHTIFAYRVCVFWRAWPGCV